MKTNIIDVFLLNNIIYYLLKNATIFGKLKIRTSYKHKIYNIYLHTHKL